MKRVCTQRRLHCAVLTALGSIIAASAGATAVQTAQSLEDLRRLSIEELANVEITSVLKRPEPLSAAPASVYVITSEDIRRSGAVSLPEALRLAPNLQVARVDAHRYAISARGFGTFESANKLLVMIDGRSIYTPVHGGVFWDQQQVLLDDIERIEVISGPGGTLWGANAVNGIINIITRSSLHTQGGLAGARFGNLDRDARARYGGKLGENGTYRIYGMGFERDNTVTATGADVHDDWQGAQGGFRADWARDDDAVTVEGDIFDNSFDAGGSTWGGNVQAQWNRQLADDSGFELQAYYDRAERRAPGSLDSLETFDLQGLHRFRLAARHEIVWGAGHRLTRDEFVVSSGSFLLDPASDTVQITNIFAQDTFALRDDLDLTFGTKIEHSSFSGFEYLPSVRLAWRLADNHTLWSAISRAVRTPTRIDRNLVGTGILVPARDFESEQLVAYEIGYRGRPTTETYLSVSFFYHDYDDLRVLTRDPDSGLLIFGNQMEGFTYGLESWGDWQVAPWWRLSAGLTLLQKRLDLSPSATTLAIDQHQGNDPDYQWSLRSRMDLTRDIELDLALRRVDDLPNPLVPGYTEADARLGWHVTENLEVSLAGFNLLDNRHPETGAPAARSEVRRSAYAGVRLRF